MNNFNKKLIINFILSPILTFFNWTIISTGILSFFSFDGSVLKWDYFPSISFGVFCIMIGTYIGIPENIFLIPEKNDE